ncbi:aminotransferase class I/II-fold pyridoxal phosphate-dependent enzyme [Sutcliffiella rhizosphaerae]|uniref:Arginine decarboxylase n=1 Tax=Sutcliffiella rhizosphaerae TaxID=2880967 RepID=A0ABM8YSV9_9BACI|nr:aminotransferase class I/II-fold pyridoxal phosphate-dependent enzyme [Sutcliffiella rhizosphaerae]CAG9623055.1 Arginine decarboxylase [Sutcliffiella rhizosphaerae]
MNQHRAPLFEGLKNHWEGLPVSGHVPGHKYGDIFPEQAKGYFQELLKLDATEISGLDDLHDPDGIIDEAQKLTAALYGADHSFFLVNGSTVGNLAMILATCRRGSKVLVQRNCHKSIINGVELAGAEPVFLACEFDTVVGVATSPSIKNLKEALCTMGDISAVILTSPNYYGLSMELEKSIQIIHEFKVPVLVDEAHGAHFVLGEPFPISALDLGADVVVHSAHKTLPAMTMGSFLHLKGQWVKREKVAYYLRMLQSSSPSYPIMASLDLARFYLASFTKDKIENLLKDIEELVSLIKGIDGVEVVDSYDKSVKKDPLKLILRSTEGVSGFTLQKSLEKEGLYVELADSQNVLIVLPLAVSEKKHDMIETIKKAAYHLKKETDKHIPVLFPPPSKETIQLEIPLAEQPLFQVVKCPLDQVEGKVAAEAIVPYPPGIPVLLKGEKVTKETMDYIKELHRLGARFQGNDLVNTNYLYIYKKEKE